MLDLNLQKYSSNIINSYSLRERGASWGKKQKRIRNQIIYNFFYCMNQPNDIQIMNINHLGLIFKIINEIGINELRRPPRKTSIFTQKASFS